MTIMPMNRPPAWETQHGLMGPRRRGGLFGASSQAATAPVAAATPQGKQGFDWGKLIGVLGDSLSIAGGGQAQFVPNLLDQRARQQAQAYAEQQYQRRRADENADWLRQEQWKRDNPAPVNNDTVADYNFYKSTLAPEQFKVWLQNKVDPPQYRQGPDGQFYRINVAPGQMPTFTEDDWNKAAPTNGGTSGTPAGGRF